MINLRADADIRGYGINLAWSWAAPDDRPPLRLIRRQGTYPTGADDALRLVDLDALFETTSVPWGRVTETRFVLTNATTEGGLVQAAVTLFYPFTAPPAVAAEPSRARITAYDPAGDTMGEVLFQPVTRVEKQLSNSPPWSAIQTWEIFAAPGGGPEASQGMLIARSGHSDGATPNQLEWFPIGPGFSIDFDDMLTTHSRVDFSAGPETLRADFVWLSGGETAGALRLDEQFDPDTGDWRRHFVFRDAGLQPETVYYYAVFAPDPANPGEWQAGRASALATGRYNLSERLYELLPALHRRYDEPDPEDRGNGQLRRFLQVFGGALDQVRSLAEGLRTRQDVLSVRGDFLPMLAQWIGWDLDQTLDVQTQRGDILFAPAVYRTVGTLPNLRALVNRASGWSCELKEFAHNVFLTNAPEVSRLWELWEQRNDGTGWTEPAPLTQTEQFDGRPTAVRDGGGMVWLFWHADRDRRRELWLQRLGVDPQPQRAILGAPDDTDGLDAVDEYPAAVRDGATLRLFWDSNRDGAWNIWTRVYTGLPGETPEPLTDHPADDRAPAAVLDAGGQVWVFWQSNRRGHWDIWARVHNGTDWQTPARLTETAARDEMPAATLDAANRLWLFWSRDLGDRRNLWCRVRDGGVWGPAQPVTDGAFRDEAPAAVLWNGELWLFWHADRGGQWRIWGQSHDGTTWSAPQPLTHYVADVKEPAAVVDGTDLRLIWRSQQRANDYRSRTIDFDDPDMLAAVGTWDDRAHYTYDTAKKNTDWYARDTVGVVLMPDTADAAVIENQVIRTQFFVEPFRPLPVRLVWLTRSEAGDELEAVAGINGLINENGE